jgi:hypothetical protein
MYKQSVFYIFARLSSPPRDLDGTFCLRVDLSAPKMPSENIRPESQQVNEFNFDTSFVSSEKKRLSDFRAGKISLRKIRSLS